MTAKPLPSRLSDNQLFGWLRLIRSENVGPRTFRALFDRYGGARAALEALPELARKGGTERPIRLASAAEVERELDVARRLGVRFLAISEPEYPPLLREIDSAPPLLLCRGRIETLQNPSVAVVGSRNASAAGLTFAERLARGLGRCGYVVVSGLARGIDQRAHVATLATGTVGVLAGGHAKPYPSDAALLIERMVEQGAVVSEMPVEQEPRGRDFPRRNRVVSGLSLATIVVEAARGSGSLITARFALEQNRQVFAVPGSPLDPRAEGTNDLLKQGATICTSAEDVTAALEPIRSRDLLSALRESNEGRWIEAGRTPADLHPAGASHPSTNEAFDRSGGPNATENERLDVVRERIAELLGPSPIPLDDLARAADASAREARVALMELELAGRVEFSGDRVALRLGGEIR
jgi:DNA processing protein